MAFQRWTSSKDSFGHQGDGGVGMMKGPKAVGEVGKSHKHRQGSSRASGTSGSATMSKEGTNNQNEGPLIKRAAVSFVGARASSCRARSHSFMIERRDNEIKASLPKEKSPAESQLYVWGKRPSSRKSKKTSPKPSSLQKPMKECREGSTCTPNSKSRDGSRNSSSRESRGKKSQMGSATKEKNATNSQFYVWGKRSSTRDSKQASSKGSSIENLVKQERKQVTSSAKGKGRSESQTNSARNSTSKESQATSVSRDKNPSDRQLYVWGKRPSRDTKDSGSKSSSRESSVKQVKTKSVTKEKRTTESQLYLWGKRPTRDSKHASSNGSSSESRSKKVKAASITKEKSPAESQLYVWGTRPSRTRSSSTSTSRNSNRRASKDQLTGSVTRTVGRDESHPKTLNDATKSVSTLTAMAATIPTKEPMNDSCANTLAVSAPRFDEGGDDTEDVATKESARNLPPSDPSTLTIGTRSCSVSTAPDEDVVSVVGSTASTKVRAMVDFFHSRTKDKSDKSVRAQDESETTVCSKAETIQECRDEEPALPKVDDDSRLPAPTTDDTSTVLGSIYQRDTYSLMLDMTDTFDDETVNGLFPSVLDKARSLLSPIRESRTFDDTDEDTFVSNGDSLDCKSKQSRFIHNTSFDGDSVSEAGSKRDSPSLYGGILRSDSFTIASKLLTKARSAVGIDHLTNQEHGPFLPKSIEEDQGQIDLSGDHNSTSVQTVAVE